MSSKRVAAALRQEKIIAFPTETTYGLGCDPRSAKAVRRLFRLKGRDVRKPLLLIAASKAQAEQVIEMARMTRAQRETYQHLTKMFWPGPLTLVLPACKSAKLHRRVVPQNEVAVRVSSSVVARGLARAFGFPLVATSANRSGQAEARSGSGVERAFAAQADGPDVIVDVGALPARKPSTVARIRKDGTLEVLRQGRIRL
jgi:L-threonylcarbamoyladenylate synthase